MGAIERALFILQGFVDDHPAASVRDVEALAAARAELEQMRAELAELANAELVVLRAQKPEAK